MIKVKENIVGKKFGNLTVIKRDNDHYTMSGLKFPKWICLCDCGNKTSVFQSSLKQGKQKSCGCKHFTACKKYNLYEIKDTNVFVKLTNCNEYMVCDLENWENLKKYCWSKGKTGYAEARVNNRTALFHHFVITCSKGMVRDHINRDKLDNRKCNLRSVSYSINNSNKHTYNKTGAKFIYKNGKGYSANFYLFGKKKYIGTYKTIEEAIAARNGVINNL